MTETPQPQQCPFCHAHGPFKRHALRETWWRDVPDNCTPRVRRGHMVRWRCVSCQQIHTQAPPWAATPRRMTQDLTGWIREQLHLGLPISRVAQASGLDDKTVRSIGRAIRQVDQTQ